MTARPPLVPATPVSMDADLATANRINMLAYGLRMEPPEFIERAMRMLAEDGTLDEIARRMHERK